MAFTELNADDVSRLVTELSKAQQRIGKLEDALRHLRSIEESYGVICYIDGVLKP
jgi:CHAD domain-containing protein